MNLVSTEPIWKASTRLADGREIVYYDESGMGVWINDIVPEEAAQRLREAL